MKTKILAILIVCLGLLALMPNVITATSTLTIILDASNCQDANLESEEESTWVNDTNYDGTNSVGWTTTPLFEFRNVIWFKDNYVANNTNITSVFLEYYAYQESSAMETISLNISVHELYSGFNETEVTWNNRTNNTVNGPWEIPGGFYNPNPIDSIEVNKTFIGWVKFDITTAYRSWANNGTKNKGLILLCTDSTVSQRYKNFRESEYGTTVEKPILNITYIGGILGGQVTDLYEDVWNLEGFSGAIPKLASTIYSEISDCTALSWKNATTGYWYTYWPSLGLTEDKYLNFGDGLFILTDQDTTWDHT